MRCRVVLCIVLASAQSAQALQALLLLHQRPPTWRGRTRQILLITDIGRDIDDTLALLTLAAYAAEGKAAIAAVVTCGALPYSPLSLSFFPPSEWREGQSFLAGGKSDVRAGVARGWLRVRINTPPIALPFDGVPTYRFPNAYALHISLL